MDTTALKHRVKQGKVIKRVRLKAAAILPSVSMNVRLSAAHADASHISYGLPEMDPETSSLLHIELRSVFTIF